jgi:hypothetical protein
MAMKRILRLCLTIVPCLTLLTTGLTSAVAADGDAAPSFSWHINPLLLGADGAVGIKWQDGANFGATSIWITAGALYGDSSFYRRFPGDTHVDILSADDTVGFKAISVRGALAASQEILLDRHVLTGFVVLKSRYDYRNPDWAPEANIFESSLPDKSDIWDHSGLAALRFDRELPPLYELGILPTVIQLNVLAEWAPEALSTAGTDYIRLGTYAKTLTQIINRIHFQLYSAFRLGFDRLSGQSVPIHARTSVGRIKPPYFGYQSALGGGVRGISAKRFDGLTKLYFNADLRMVLPLDFIITPTVTLFADAGVSDYGSLSGVLDFQNLFTTAGVSGSVNVAGITDIGVAVTYAFNEPDPSRRLGYEILFGKHF